MVQEYEGIERHEMQCFFDRCERAPQNGRKDGTLPSASDAWEALGAVLWTTPRTAWSFMIRGFDDMQIQLVLQDSWFSALRAMLQNGPAIYRQKTREQPSGRIQVTHTHLGSARDSLMTGVSRRGESSTL